MRNISHVNFHWEPTIENMPKTYKEVKVRDGCGDIHTAMWTGTCWHFANGGVSCDITAWMVSEEQTV